MSAMQAAMQAVNQQNKIKPAFTVKKLAGTVEKLIHRFDKTNNKIVSKKEKVDAGWLVRFMKGHSIRCYTEEDLARIGANYHMIPLMNTETGEVVGSVPNTAVEKDEE